MKPLHRTLCGAAGVIAIATALLHLPLNRTMAGLQAPLTFVDAVTLTSGTVYVKPNQTSLWRIHYRWCPSQGLTSWCMEGRSDESFVQGVAHWHGGTALTLADIEMSVDSDQLPGVSSMASFTLTGSAEQVAVVSLACGQQHIAVNNAQATFSNLRVLGKNLLDSQVSVHGSQPPQLSLKGSFTGSGQIDNGTLSLQVQPAATADTPTTNSGWSFRAKLPCLT